MDLRIYKAREDSMNNRNKAAGFGVGVALGAAFGLVAGILYTIISAERAEELLREQKRQARYKSPEYAKRARAAIDEARKRAANQ